MKKKNCDIPSGVTVGITAAAAAVAIIAARVTTAAAAAGAVTTTVGRHVRDQGVLRVEVMSRLTRCWLVDKKPIVARWRKAWE